MLRSTLKIIALLASFSFVAACGGDDGPDCSDTMAQMRGAMVIGASCVGCHGSSVTGDDRNGAPATVNLDGAANIDMHETGIRNRAISQKNMPPAPPLGTGALSASQISDLQAFLDCR